MLVVHTGPMFAGKTTNLIKNVKFFNDIGLNSIIFSPNVDCRKNRDIVKTHDGVEYKAVSVAENEDFITKAKEYEVIAFDEIQFFSEGVIYDIKKLIDMGRIVIIAGLDMDYMGNPFYITAMVMAMADTVIKHKGKCNYCNRPSQFSYRFTNTNEIVDIGAGDKYKPVCRACFNRLMCGEDK